MGERHDQWLAGLIDRLTTTYKRHNDIMRDRRLNDPDRLKLLEAWPCRDDFERGEVARAKQEIAARMAAGG